MQGEAKDRWMKLCEQAAIEQDSNKLIDLVRQINDLLSEKQRRIESRKPLSSTGSAALRSVQSLPR